MINGFLEYQAIDKELYRLERELRDSAERKNYGKFKKAVNEASEQLQKLDGEASELLKSFDRLSASKEQFVSEMKDIEEAAAGTNELDELKYYQSKLNKLDETAQTIEKEIAMIIARIEEIGAGYTELMERGKRATIAMRKAKDEYETLQKQKKPQMSELQAKLEALKPKLDAKLLEHYYRLREDKKMPVFVPYSLEANNKSCRGCGVELSYNELAKLKAVGDYTECANCRRIIYAD